MPVHLNLQQFLKFTNRGVQLSKEELHILEFNEKDYEDFTQFNAFLAKLAEGVFPSQLEIQGLIVDEVYFKPLSEQLANCIFPEHVKKINFVFDSFPKAINPDCIILLARALGHSTHAELTMFEITYRPIDHRLIYHHVYFDSLYRANDGDKDFIKSISKILINGKYAENMKFKFQFPNSLDKEMMECLSTTLTHKNCHEPLELSFNKFSENLLVPMKDLLTHDNCIEKLKVIFELGFAQQNNAEVPNFLPLFTDKKCIINKFYIGFPGDFNRLSKLDQIIQQIGQCSFGEVEFHFEYSDHLNDLIPILAQMLNSVSNINHLMLNLHQFFGEYNIQEGKFNLIIEAIAKNENLLNLTINMDQIFNRESTFKNLLNLLQFSKSTKALELLLSTTRNTNVKLEFVTDLLASGNYPANLKINLKGYQDEIVNENAIKKIAKAMQSEHCNKPYILNLSVNNINDATWKYIVDALASGKCSSGITLDVSGNKISDEGMAYFLNKLNLQFPEYLTLNLVSNPIGTYGLNQLTHTVNDKSTPAGFSISTGYPSFSDDIKSPLISYSAKQLVWDLSIKEKLLPRDFYYVDFQYSRSNDSNGKLESELNVEFEKKWKQNTIRHAALTITTFEQGIAQNMKMTVLPSELRDKIYCDFLFFSLPTKHLQKNHMEINVLEKIATLNKARKIIFDKQKKNTEILLEESESSNSTDIYHQLNTRR